MSDIFKYRDTSEDEDEVCIISDYSSEGNCSEEEGPKPKRASLTEKASVKSVSKLRQESAQTVKRPQAKKRADVERNSPPMSSTQTSADFGVTTEPIDEPTGRGSNQRARKRYPNDRARKSFPHRSNFVNFHEIYKKK